MEHSPRRPQPLSPSVLLLRVLEEPALVSAVRALPPQTLGELVQHVGLEDSAELIGLTTTQQLRWILENDLWGNGRPGQAEAFDPDRFALWLEVMLEAGEAFTASKLAELPEELVMLALHQQVLVMDLDELALAMEGGGHQVELLDKALDSCLYHELDRYQIISRRHEGWDAVLTALVALDRDHHDLLQRILARCCHACTELVEDSGGLYDVLTSEQMLEEDAAAEREDRRAGAGYVEPRAAAAFLALARTTRVQAMLKARAADPITAAYFRELRPGLPADPRAPAASPARASRLATLLARAGVETGPSSTRLLEAGELSQSQPAEGFRQALEALARLQPGGHQQRMGELGYLANVLVAGCPLAGRRFRPAEAAEAALATCNLGLEHALSHREAPPQKVLADLGATRLFRVGWRLLYTRLSLPAGCHLQDLLSGWLEQEENRAEPFVGEIERIHQRHEQSMVDGKPWKIHEHLGSIAAIMERPLLEAFQGALDHCPHQEQAGERTFVATWRQLERIAFA